MAIPPASCPSCTTPGWERSESLATFCQKLFDTSDFPDRWRCGTWSLQLGSLHIVADFLTFAAYFAIPAMIAVYMLRRRDNIPFPRLAALFAAFILLCGAGHLLEVVIFWWPAYRLAGLLKLATALVSVTTAVVLYRLLPAALELPGITRMNEQLKREVAQRAAAEREAELADSHKQAILNSTMTVSIIATDSRGVITLFNRGAERLLGYDPRQVIGQLTPAALHDRDEILRRAAQFGVKDCETTDLISVIDELANSPGCLGHDWTYLTQSGERRIVSLAVSRLADDDGTPLGYLHVATDVTEQRAQENELRKLAIVARKTINAVVIADHNRRIEWVNDSFTRMTGYTLDEVRGRTPGHFLQGPETNRQTVEGIRAALDAGEVYQGEIYNYDKAGNGYWQALTITPVQSSDGTPAGFISVQTDITQVRMALDAADAANRAKSEFLANMSHEIRTPMTAILGFSEVLQSEVRDPEAREMIDSIHRNGEHLLLLINDILDLSKIEAGHLKLNFEHIPLRQTTNEVVETLRIRAVAKSLALSLRFDDDVPAEFLTDVTRFRQILVNLIGNAIKFTDEGGVTVQVRLQIIGPGERRLAVDVIDTGIGIPLDQQANLFRPFQQVDGSVTRRHGGTGLGLSISQRLAESFGGAIELRSTPGRGSCFTFLSGPLDPVSVPQETLARQADQLETCGLQGTRVSLISHASASPKGVELILRRAGANLTTIPGNMTPETLQRTVAGSDVVLIDLSHGIPVPSGYATQFRVRRSFMVVAALLPRAPYGEEIKNFVADCDVAIEWPVSAARLLGSLVGCLHPHEAENSMSMASSRYDS